MTTKGFEALSQALSATTITEPAQVTEQERQALYTAIYHADGNKRRVFMRKTTPPHCTQFLFAAIG